MEKTSNSLVKYVIPPDTRPFSQCLSEFLDTTPGRDKIFRLFQYYAKWILPLIKNKVALANLAKFLEGFSALCGLGRKMLRLGKQVNTYRSIMARIKKPAAEKEFNDIIKTISDLSNAFYFLLDHILLINRLNVFKWDPAWILKVDWYSNLAWGVECFTNIIYDVIDYSKNDKLINKYQSDLDKIENFESEEYRGLIEKKTKLKHEQFKKVVDLARCIFDMPLIVHFLTSDQVLSNSKAGFFGIISSLIGCYQKWVK